MGGNTAEDERRFATAARVSEINLANYRNFVQPWIRATVTPQVAELMRKWHPLRVSYEAFGSDNAAMKAVAKTADKAREHRKPATEDNPFVKLQETFSKNLVDVLDKWRDTQEALSETLFHGIYGSPVVQAAVGIKPDADVSPRPEMSEEYRKRLDARIAELKSQIGSGSLRECVIRGLRCRLAAHAGAVQADRARAVLHAAAGAGGDPRRHPEAAAAGRGRTSRRPGRHTRRPFRKRRNLRRDRHAVRSRGTAVRADRRGAGEGVVDVVSDWSWT
jgi:hypothetical protein